MATPISDENALTGTDQWDIHGTGIGSLTIQGYATAMSVVQGGTLSFKVHSPSASWTATVYRLGWYAGLGGREYDVIAGPATTQPAGTVDPVTLAASCANWTVNGTWSVPADATPGMYVIKLRRDDNATLTSHIGPFAVRDPGRKAPILVKASDTTWQAYNHAGTNPSNVLDGRSVYGEGDGGGFEFWQSGATRARAASYDRPFVTRQWLPQTWFFNAEYPLLRWLERCGYDVDYAMCADVDADPSLLLGRDIVISSGHDEYTSPQMWDAFAQACDTGVNLVFLTGNEFFWRINWATDRRSFACWKDTHDGALNATGTYSGTWQDTRAFNPDRRPAALLIGQRFRLNGIAAHPPVATATHAASPFWRDTAVADLTGPDTWTGPDGIVGFEGDEPADTDPAEAPANLIRLSQTSFPVTDGLSDDDGDTYVEDGTYTHAFTLYRADSGALVFGAGTNQYAWALDNIHDRSPNNLEDPDLKQALANLLADMGALPDTPPAGLVVPTPVPASAYGFGATVANAAYNAFLQGVLNAEYDLNTATIKCALVRGYTFDATDATVADVVAGGGTINGTSAALANPTITNGTFDADDTTISTTASAVDHGLLVFQASAVTGGADVAQSSQKVIAWYDTGTGLRVPG